MSTTMQHGTFLAFLLDTQETIPRHLKTAFIDALLESIDPDYLLHGDAGTTLEKIKNAEFRKDLTTLVDHVAHYAQLEGYFTRIAGNRLQLSNFRGYAISADNHYRAIQPEYAALKEKFTTKFKEYCAFHDTLGCCKE